MKDDKGRFKKGYSGNPKGKPPGARHKATQAALSLLEGDAEALSRKAVELALEGDTTALRLCLERVAPAARERPIHGYTLPELNSHEDVLQTLKEVAGKLAAGELLPSEAGAICSVLEQYRKHYETTDLEAKLAAIEQTLSIRAK